MDTNPAQPEPRGNLSGLALYDWDNLLLAYRKAAKGKRGHADVAEFEYRLEANLLRLQRELQEQTYQPGAYHSFYIHDPKKRLISAAPYCLVSVDGLKNHPRIFHECTKTEGHSFTVPSGAAVSRYSWPNSWTAFPRRGLTHSTLCLDKLNNPLNSCKSFGLIPRNAKQPFNQLHNSSFTDY